MADPDPNTAEMVTLVRIESKIDRLKDSVDRAHQDLAVVRERVHEHANDITALKTLNIPEKLGAITTEIADHDRQLATFRSDLDQRRGALAAMKFAWAAGGGIGAAGLIGILKLFGVH